MIRLLKKKKAEWMKNSEYWKLRFVQLEEEQNKLANEGCKEIEGIYGRR